VVDVFGKKYYLCKKTSIMNTLEVTEKDFLAHPKTYLDLSDSGTHVVLHYGMKTYAIVPGAAANSADAYFADPQIATRLRRSIAQADRGETHPLAKEDIRAFLGLENV
jgi:hypothetical protein